MDYISKLQGVWNEKLFEGSGMQQTICIFILLVLRTANIRPTPTDGSFQLPELEIFMQQAKQSELLRDFLNKINMEKSATSHKATSV